MLVDGTGDRTQDLILAKRKVLIVKASFAIIQPRMNGSEAELLKELKIQNSHKEEKRHGVRVFQLVPREPKPSFSFDLFFYTGNAHGGRANITDKSTYLMLIKPSYISRWGLEGKRKLGQSWV